MTQLPPKPITEKWLEDVGFRWHQLERQPTKQWLLWLGYMTMRPFGAPEDLGITLSPPWTILKPEDWSVFLRADYCGRYNRFIHVRTVRWQDEVIQLVEALTGCQWMPENNIAGYMRTAEQAAYCRAEATRLDRLLLQNKWSDIEKDDTRGGALPEHMEGYVKQNLEGSGLRKLP